MTNATSLLELLQKTEGLTDEDLQDVDYMLTKLDEWLEDDLIADEDYETLQDYYGDLASN